MFILGYQWVNSERRDKNAETAVYARFTGTRSWSVQDAVENFNHNSEVGAGAGTG
ncbi:unnamed protein product [Brassica oleracea var. botrytis]|uniref:Uncharacterized protein n=3 Tax=Brassica TaxID=3705 RepID=A0A0D3DRK6_BRAOL|nr:unnamed protein product [Brassica napus]VDD56814.1 unnamed protein product [Brassica oleracea]